MVNSSNLIYGIHGVSKIIVETQARKFNFTQVFSWHIRLHCEAQQTNTHLGRYFTLQFFYVLFIKTRNNSKDSLVNWKIMNFKRNSWQMYLRSLLDSDVLDNNWTTTPISTPGLFSWLREIRALGNPETKCLLIGFREEQSKASLIGAFMLARGVSRRRKVQIASFWL